MYGLTCRIPRYHYERCYGGGGHSTSASTDEDEQSGQDPATKRRMTAPRAISDVTYTELMKMLKSEASIAFRDMSLPAKSAYRLVHRHKEQLMVDMVFDPLDGCEKERICYMPTCDRTRKLILLRQSEVNRVINLYYQLINKARGNFNTDHSQLHVGVHHALCSCTVQT